MRSLYLQTLPAVNKDNVWLAASVVPWLCWTDGMPRQRLTAGGDVGPGTTGTSGLIQGATVIAWLYGSVLQVTWMQRGATQTGAFPTRGLAGS